MAKRPEFTSMTEAARVSSFMAEDSVGRWKLKRFTVTEAEETLSRGVAVAQSSTEEEATARLARTVPAGDYICLQRKATPMERKDIADESVVDAYSPDGPEWVPIMSDTPAEIGEHGHAFEHAKGQVLITGLGLGVLVSALLAKPCGACEGKGEVDVEDWQPPDQPGVTTCLSCGGTGKAVSHITVIEIDRDVIALTGPYYEDDPRVTIVSDDALRFAQRRGTNTGWVHPDRRYDYAWHDIWSHISERNLDDDSLAEHGISYKTLFDAYAHFCKKQGAWAYPEALNQRRVRDIERQLMQDWRHTMLFSTSDEEKIDCLIDRAIRGQSIGLPVGGPIPDEVRKFFEEQGLREWAEQIIREDGLNMEKIRRDYENGGGDKHDPMDRPNEVEEANVAGR